MPNHLHFVHGCFHSTMAELSSYNRECTAHTQKCYYLTLYSKSMLTPGLDALAATSNYCYFNAVDVLFFFGKFTCCLLRKQGLGLLCFVESPKHT